MAAVGTHPLVTVVILFVLFFSVFFLLIYGGLRFLERRKESKEKTPDRLTTSGQNSAQPKNAESKFCPKCGTKMPQFADFCPECGAPQIPASS